MKTVILSLLLFFVYLYAEILEVDINGTQNFTSIQAAVEAAADGDTILVHPGIYAENVFIAEKAITLGSLELITGDSAYIHTTIIDGNQTGGCIWVENAVGGIIQGFTLQNGSGTLQPNTTRRGGGIGAENSSLQVINNHIVNNKASVGGGIMLYISDIFLSGTHVYKNHSFDRGGGIAINHESHVTFDPENRSSIYLNTARSGNDLYVMAPDHDIILDMFTVMQPDNFFISARGHAPYYPVIEYTFTCIQAAIEPVEADLYVSAEGDDSNSGLSAEEPLQTMALAFIKIQPDSLFERTIHVANGVYSPSLTNEKFPLNLRSYISIIGESEAHTIIDGENKPSSIMTAWNGEKEMKIKNFTVQNVKIGFFDISPFLFLSYSVAGETISFSVTLENLTITDVTPLEWDDNANAIYISRADYAILKNITIDNCIGFKPLGINGWNITGENIKVTNTRGGTQFSAGGAMALTNLVQSEGEVNRFFNLELSNNEDILTDWSISSALQIVAGNEVIISNATITNNTCQGGYGGAITIEGAKLTLINSIVHNNIPYPVQLRETPIHGAANLTVINSLFTYGDENIMTTGECNLNWLDGNISGDPLFANTIDNTYFLQNTSPCIDAGTLDLAQYFGEDFEIPEYDLAGNQRIYGNGIDIGAYEWNPDVSNSNHVFYGSENFKISNFPNPFNPTTTIQFSGEFFEQNEQITLEIFNIKGQRVKQFTMKNEKSKMNEVVWDGADDFQKPVSSGIYFYKLKSINHEVTNRMLLMK